MDREKIIAALNEYFGMNSKDGTYAYWLTRVKEAFGVGTVTLDDFQEFTDENIDELADCIRQVVKSEVNKMLQNIYKVVWETDIPSPTCPEYIEHHRDIQDILAVINKEIAEVNK